MSSMTGTREEVVILRIRLDVKVCLNVALTDNPQLQIQKFNRLCLKAVVPFNLYDRMHTAILWAVFLNLGTSTGYF